MHKLFKCYGMPTVLYCMAEMFILISVQHLKNFLFCPCGYT